MYHFIHLETMEENRVEADGLAELVNFKTFENLDEAKEFFQGTLEHMKIENEFINVIECPKRGIIYPREKVIRSVLFQGEEFYRQLILIEGDKL